MLAVAVSLVTELELGLGALVINGLELQDASVGASSVAQLERNVAAADIELTDDESRALEDAAAQFRPVTGVAALPGVLRARLRR